MFTTKKYMPLKQILSAFLSVCLLFAMLFVIGQTASAAEEVKNEDIVISINYVTEQLIIGSSDYTVANGAKPIYMYSPNVSLTSTPKKQAAEKWYPVYGNTIDIQKYIPSTLEKECIFAVRLASELPGEDGTYKSRDIVIIAGRPSVTGAELKRRVAYNPLSEKLEVDDYLSSMGYDFQIDLGGWNYNMKQDLNVSSKYMPLGGVVTIRQSANQSAGIFASNSIKIKIPKAASVPSIKVTAEKERIIGIVKNTGWSAYEEGPYREFNDTTIEFNLFEAKVASIDAFDVEVVTTSDGKKVEYLIMYVKTLATEKKPSSPTKKLYIPIDLLSGQIKGE